VHCDNGLEPDVFIVAENYLLVFRLIDHFEEIHLSFSREECKFAARLHNLDSTVAFCVKQGDRPGKNTSSFTAGITRLDAVLVRSWRCFRD
jgi:hypothetical protein